MIDSASAIAANQDAIARWWRCENDRPMLAYTQWNAYPEEKAGDKADYFPTPDSAPDFDGMMADWAGGLRRARFFGAEIPVLHHSWGGRGTPMVNAAFLGGNVTFTRDSVWAGPVIDTINTWDAAFDPDNRWLRCALSLFDAQMERVDPSAMTAGMPDFGDYLTVLSLLRGTQRLLFDVIEHPDALHRLREQMLPLWKRYHSLFWDRYRARLSGDQSWLIWAPGKTYAVQCDFSTMISPDMFREFVAPELTGLGEYLDYMVWHLDGPEELKHLDTLLSLDCIKAIQWVPGAGNEPAASPQWRTMLRTVQNAGRALCLHADDPDQARTLMRELRPQGLFIRVGGGFESDDPGAIGASFGDAADFGYFEINKQSAG
jgi:5-methyltetrahydrofolate--homocysteine methyltransferase